MASINDQNDVYADIGEGGADPRLWCQFQHEDLSPRNIKLTLGPSGVAWEYILNTSVQDTYGGQVIQILGVTVTGLTIKGNFGGIDPQWGADQRGDGSFLALRPVDNPNPRFGDYNWIQDPSHPWVNGIQQLADWFRQYFELTTQGGANRRGAFERYNQQSMRFIAPEWTVQADFVEEAEYDRSFLRDVEKTALDRLEELKVGIGYRKQNPFSEFIKDGVSNEEAAFKIIDTYQESVLKGLTEDEIDDLIEFGFSYPGSVYKRAGYNPDDFLDDDLLKNIFR
jgi:hypothetical protein